MNERDLPEVVMINRKRALALLEGGDIVPVTNWFDDRGEECDPDDAVACVCGNDETGWYVIHFAQHDFVYATVH